MTVRHDRSMSINQNLLAVLLHPQVLAFRRTRSTWQPGLVRTRRNEANSESIPSFARSQLDAIAFLGAALTTRQEDKNFSKNLI
jgi:hypothetical protein